MDIRTKIIINLPEPLIEALQITEDTPFLVRFEDGSLIIEPLFLDGEDSGEDFSPSSGYCGCREEEEEDEYPDGFEDGYEEGYRFGFHDGSNMRKFNKSYPRDCGIDCDYDCRNCRCR